MPIRRPLQPADEGNPLDGDDLLPRREDTASLGCTPGTDPSKQLAKGSLSGRLGRFVILQELGRGGMGVVYKAEDSASGRVVALKTMQGASPAALSRFKQEFRSLAEFHHPNLALLHELFADGEQWFFTMEFVDGVDFLTHVRADDLARGRLLSPGTAPRGQAHLSRLRAAFAQLAVGIRALHVGGRLHRDIKPGNVRVTPEGRVVLLDFGLATFLDRSGIHASSDGLVVGTLAYMSPEQAAAKPVSAAADWYSVGVMLYEALTGHLPYRGGALQAITTKSLPPPPSEVSPGVPEDLSQLCLDLLHTTPANRPDGKDVVSRLGVEGSEASERPHRATFVGRDGHLQALRDCLRTASSGRAVVVRIPGPSGVGKSALVQAFLDSAVGVEGAVVLAGKCYEQESVPYKAVDGVIDSLARYLAGLPPLEAQSLLPRDVWSLARTFPVLGRVPGISQVPPPGQEIPDLQELRRRAFTGLQELFGRLGDRRPLVICIDDLQWGDADSAVLFEELLRAPGVPSLLLLLCYRSEEVADNGVLRALLDAINRPLDHVDHHDLPVEPLGVEEARHLAELLIDNHDLPIQGKVDEVVRESGGSPFLVWELVESVRSGVGATGDSQVTAEGVIRDRIGRLPDLSRRLLAALAVAGRAIPKSVVSLAANLGPEEPAIFAALRSNRLVRGVATNDDGLVAAYHDKVREAVLANLSSNEIRAWHARLADVMESIGGCDPEWLALHHDGAGNATEAGRYYILSAERADKALAFDHAAGLYRRGLALWEGDEELARQTRVRLADSLANARRGGESAVEYLAALPATKNVEAIELRRRASEQYLISGRLDKGIEALSPALEALGLSLPSGAIQTITRILWHRLLLAIRGVSFDDNSGRSLSPMELIKIDLCSSVVAGLGNVDPLVAASFQPLALLLALRAGDRNRIAREMAYEAATTAATSRSEARINRLLSGAERLVNASSPPFVHGALGLARGVVAFEKFQWKPALAHFDDAEYIYRSRCKGYNGDINITVSLISSCLIQMGRFKELINRVPQILDEAKDHSDIGLSLNMLTIPNVLCKLTMDLPEQAIADHLEVRKHLPQNRYTIHHFLDLAAWVATQLYTGCHKNAWETAESHKAQFSRSIIMKVHYPRVSMISDHGRAAIAYALATGSKSAIRAAKLDARSLRRENAAWPTGLANLLDAGIATIAGKPKVAVSHTVSAIELFDANDMPFHASCSRFRLGQMLGGNEGRRLIRQGEEWMSDQGVKRPDKMTDIIFPRCQL